MKPLRQVLSHPDARPRDAAYLALAALLLAPVPVLLWVRYLRLLWWLILG